MSKITLNNVGSLIDATTAQETINNNFETIQEAFDNTLSRDGETPNVVEATVDMNSQHLINLPAPISGSSPLRLTDAATLNGGGTIPSLPTGGTTGQFLSKASNADFDFQYSNGVASVGLSMPSDYQIAGSPVTSSGTLAVTHTTAPTGTGGFVRATSPTLVTPILGVASGTSLNLSGLTASQSVQTDGSKNLVSLANTGTGNNVLATSPTLVTPVLGTPASGTLTNCTGLPISTGVSGLAANVATFLATPSSANLASAMTDETGSGANVFATSPTLVTPLLGTPTSGTLTNCTGLPVSTDISGLGANVATFLATPSSANLASAVTNETGSGLLVFGTSPTLSTPAIVGRTDAGSASAGNVGEHVESIIAAGSAVSLTNGVSANVTSISLTAGDWEVFGSVVMNPAATTSITTYGGSISTVSATFDTTYFNFERINATVPANPTGGFVIDRRVNISSTTTIYLVALSNFTVSTMTAYGRIRARRVQS